MIETAANSGGTRRPPGSPLVIVQWAAVRLQVTPQAVEAMLKELGGSLPSELTRKRYRAWGSCNTGDVTT